MNLLQEQRGDMRQMLQSPFWGAAIRSLLIDADIWRRSLLQDDDLSEGRRKGYVLALAAVRSMLTHLYEEAGIDLPDHIKRRTGEV